MRRDTLQHVADLPARGASVRRLGLSLPPGRMPARQGWRPLKRWRYVGVFTPRLMLCVGEARVGPIPQRWWAVALPDGTLRERTTIGRGGVEMAGSGVRVAAGGVSIRVDLGDGDGVETASPAGGSYIWTRKQAAVPCSGEVTLDGVRYEIAGECAFVDESAGYHERHTSWRWSAGVGLAQGGEPVGWNLVTGLHDAPGAPSAPSGWTESPARRRPWTSRPIYPPSVACVSPSGRRARTTRTSWCSARTTVSPSAPSPASCPAQSASPRATA